MGAEGAPGERAALAARAREVWRASMAEHGLAAGKVRVFSENDVRRLLFAFQAQEADVEEALAQFEGELTEEVVARSTVVRLVRDAVEGLWEPNSQDPADMSQEEAEGFVEARLPQLRPTEPVVAMSRVRELLRPLLRVLVKDRGMDLSDLQLDAITDEANRVLAEMEPEPPVPRSEVDRLLALALVWGAHDQDGIPGDVWEALYREGLLASAGDQSGESWPVVTRAGQEYLQRALARDR